MSDQVGDPVSVAVAIVKGHRGRCDARERALARCGISVRPRIEPGIHRVGSSGVRHIGRNVREERELAPTLMCELRACSSATSCVSRRSRRGSDRFQIDPDTRSARRNHLAVGVAVGEDDPLGCDDSITSPVASLPPGYTMRKRPPGRGSISDPGPHHAPSAASRSGTKTLSPVMPDHEVAVDSM
jgi:hypothetical protein